MPRANKNHDGEQALLQWATDILYISSNPVSNANDTESQRFIRDWLEESPANKKEFLKAFVPKAIDLVAKYGADVEDDAVVAEEKRKISDLKKTISQLVDKARSDAEIPKQGTFLLPKPDYEDLSLVPV